jgi:hypothetical protein
MPERLQTMFLANCKKSQNFLAETRGTFSEFIDMSLIWSATNEGSDFWDLVSRTEPESLYIILEHKPFSEHFETLNEVQKQFYLKYCGHGLGSLFFKKVGKFAEFINKIIWDETAVGRKYWECLSKGINQEYTARIEADFSAPTQTINGGAIMRINAVELSEAYYGAKRYIDPAGSISVVSAISFGFDNVKVLKQDAVRVHNNGSGYNYFTKKSLEALKIIEFNGEYYQSEGALNSRSIFKITLAEGETVYEKVAPSTHIYWNNVTYMRKTDIPEYLVNINYRNGGFDSYADRNSHHVFKCDVSGLYFSESYHSRLNIKFVAPDGATEILRYVSDFSGLSSQIYKSQRVSPIRFETDLSGSSNVIFLSRESAINSGLTLSDCPHCNKHVSNFHDFEACKRQNFQNVRYDYHGQKPKLVRSRAEFKIGVEIEKESYEGACHKAPVIFRQFGWVKERDGSLDSHVGYELVSPCYPLFSNKLYAEAVEIERAFPDLINGEISSACGGHIHFSRKNTRGHNLLEMYCGYLPLLYAIYKSRTKLTYSAAKDKDELKDSGEKYQAVRVLNDRIEFRIFPAVKNLKSLKWRIDLLRYMAKNPTESPLKVVNDLCDKRTSIHQLFKEIFSEQTIYKRAIDTLIMAKRYDSNYYNIDFSKQTKIINAKAKRQAKK